VQKFGADATRIALADGGDGIDDANFEETSANATILKLFELKRWMENTIQYAWLLELGEGFDQVRATVKFEKVDSIQRAGAGQQGGVVFWLASLLAPPFICRYLPTFSLSLLTLTIEAAPEYRGMASGF
jgi:hypothetical protein